VNYNTRRIKTRNIDGVGGPGCPCCRAGHSSKRAATVAYNRVIRRRAGQRLRTLRELAASAGDWSETVVSPWEESRGI